MSKLFEDSINSYGLELIFQDEPIEHQDTTSEIDAPTDQAPKHGDGSSSEYGFDWLFDEEDTAGEYTRLDAAPQAQADAPARDEASAMSPPTQESPSGDTQNDHTPSEEASTDNRPSDDALMTDETTERMPVKSTTVEQMPVGGASANNISMVDKATDETPTSRAPKKPRPVQLLGIEYGPAHNASVQNSHVQHAIMKNVNTEGAPAQKGSVEKTSTKGDGKKYASSAKAPINLHIEYTSPQHVAGHNTTQDAALDEVLEDAFPEEVPAAIASAEHNDENKPMPDPPKDDTTMPDALTAAEFNPADAADAFSTLTLVPQTASTHPNDYTKPKTIQSATISPLSSPGTSPRRRKGLQQIVTASKIAGTLQLAARKRKVDKAGHSAGPDAKRKKLGPTTTTTTVPAPRLKRRRKSGVSTRGFGATKIPTRSITRNATTRNVTTRSVARSITRSAAIAFTAAAPAPPTQALGKRKAYTINIGHSTSPSANKRVKLSPSPTPTPASSPTLTTRRVTRAAAATSIAIATRGRTAMPTPTARHTRSKGSQYLLYSADIVGLERGLRRRS